MAYQLRRPERHRHAVHAVAQAGRLGAIVEDVAQVPATAAAEHLGARHSVAVVLPLEDGVVHRFPEARPAGAAVEFGRRREQGLAAARAPEGPGTVLVVEWAAVRSLGARRPKHVILLRGQEVPPLLVGVVDLERFERSARSAGRIEGGQRAGTGERTKPGAEQHAPTVQNRTRWWGSSHPSNIRLVLRRRP